MNVKTYLINLESSHARLQQATRQLQQAGVAFSRFAAVDGRGKALSEFKDYSDQQAKAQLGRSLLNAEIGCYLSHRGCVEQFLTTDADYLIVLEDDIQIVPDFKKAVDAILNYLHSHQQLDWHLINLGAKKKKMARNIATFGQHTLCHAYYFPIRTIGLIWSRKGAQAFLDMDNCIDRPIDITFQDWLSHSGKGLSVWPPLVRPSGVDSDILGTVATQGIQRKDIEQRNLDYGWKKQKRLWRDRYYALTHLLF